MKAETPFVIGSIPAQTRVQGNEEADNGRQFERDHRPERGSYEGLAPLAGTLRMLTAHASENENKRKAEPGRRLGVTGSIEGSPSHPQTYQCKHPSYDT